MPFVEDCSACDHSGDLPGQVDDRKLGSAVQLAHPEKEQDGTLSAKSIYNDTQSVLPRKRRWNEDQTNNNISLHSNRHLPENRLLAILSASNQIRFNQKWEFVA